MRIPSGPGDQRIANQRPNISTLSASTHRECLTVEGGPYKRNILVGETEGSLLGEARPRSAAFKCNSDQFNLSKSAVDRRKLTKESELQGARESEVGHT